MKNIKNIILVGVLIILTLIMLLASIDVRFYITYGVLAVGVIALLGATISSLFSNFKNNLKSIIGAIGLAVLFVLFYFITPINDIAVETFEKTGTGMGWSSVIGGGLYLVYALLGIMVLLVIFSQVKKLID